MSLNTEAKLSFSPFAIHQLENEGIIKHVAQKLANRTGAKLQLTQEWEKRKKIFFFELKFIKVFRKGPSGDENGHSKTSDRVLSISKVHPYIINSKISVNKPR